MTSADDEARWSEAQSILDRTHTDSAARRLRRSQRTMWLLVASGVVSGLALGAVVAALLAGGSSPSPDDVPNAQAVAGLGLSGVGLLVMVFGIYRQIRGVRRARGYGSPLRVLTRRQRRELLMMVRGRVPVQPTRVPLARHLAELMEVQWLVVVGQTGLLLNFTGLWIAGPSTWRLVIVGVFAPLVLAGAFVFGKSYREAQRFLDQHPEDARGPAAE